ncbi:hypothetical protein A11A3_01470 [Alcanivorax hongdengensis A-11-3]|uniref:DUF8198 domain-containing protein n=1 Tax=Alcanivorax hongdengensis A-11-3 TaxID=1177179 RepID=L0WIW6_9GAMM|nr:hypothetical protein [Alcanivorax hongdengensis]EKF76122.1 hypothetical protein A11A3_01470 [Alcanivorax hongdengensis A-11-3]
MTAGEQLQHYLERFFALRQHDDDAVFLARLRRLQDWQSQRLRHTHRHLLDDTATAPGIDFLLVDVYGGRDLLPVARDIRRALPKAMRLLPDKVMATSASALEAAILTQELDEAITTHLGERLEQPLDEASYLAAFRQEGHRADRQRQLQLVAELGHRLDRYIRSRMLQTTFKMVRKPAHAAGFANLYDFMDRSFRVMKPVPSVGLLLEQLAAREEAIMDKVFAHHPAPFED